MATVTTTARLLAIRLSEKCEEHPELAAQLDVTVTIVRKEDSDDQQHD